MFTATHTTTEATWRSAGARLRSIHRSCTTEAGVMNGNKPSEVSIFGTHRPIRREVPLQ